MDVVIYVIKDDIGLFMETKLLEPVEEYCESVEDVEEEEVIDCELKEEVSGVQKFVEVNSDIDEE